MVFKKDWNFSFIVQQGEQCCQPGIDIKDCPVGRHLDCHANEVCQDDNSDGKWFCACVEGFSLLIPLKKHLTSDHQEN